MEPFVLKTDTELALLMLEPWKHYRGITAGFTGRHGGSGKLPYDTLNCAFHVGDDPNDVIDNRSKVAEMLGYSLESWTCGEQVHSRDIAIVREEDVGRGCRDRSSAIQDTDGLLTDVPGVLLTSFYADCVPLYFYDPVKQVVGLAHAGWKGTVAQIALHMVQKMEQQYGSHSYDIVAAIGPSIGSCCYEVDDVVMSKVYDLEKRVMGNEKYSSSWYVNKKDGKSMLNLKEMNRHLMIKAGILPIHIECTTWCTSCNNDLFFSFRKDGGVTGRMASWIGLK
ncbi:YfiH family protein [Paenibacillus sp. DS2015]|uniref:peptidoglycan editing factor PgeF n=1 Tax=Paenibacillus sp. DS2015 TaxID=3373917 RepID=UPI003D2570D0